MVPPPPGEIAPQAEALIAATGADFRIGGARAYYNVTGNFVQMPSPGAYFKPINWHRTAFHELGHWTGAASRLKRDHSGSFGSKSYAREELVAENGGRLRLRLARHRADGCATPITSARDWRCLREDNRAVVRAASAAWKASDFLLAFLPETSIAAVSDEAA